MAEQRLRYSVARYVPNLIRDEAVNVGVVVQDTESCQVAFKFIPRAAAVRRLWPDADDKIIELLESQLERATRWNSDFGRAGKPKDREFLDRLAYEFTGTLQLTQPRGRVSVSLDDGVNKLFQTYVAEPSEFRPIRYSVLAPVRLQRRLWDAFERKQLIREGAFRRRLTLPGKHSPWTFDLVLQQDGRAHIVNSLALNVPAPDAKSGRAFVLRGMVEDVRNFSLEVKASAVVEAPKKPDDMAGYAVAEAILIDAGIDIVRVEELNNFIADVDREIRGLSGVRR